MTAELLAEASRIAVLAGESILQVYHADTPAAVTLKQDGTPVTRADRQADALIKNCLRGLTPDLPVVSEESVEAIPFSERQAWPEFWLVDPLDGTKEFIERTGEFSVNIALIQQAHPLLGVVYAPLTRQLYCALRGLGAYKITVPVAPSESFWQQCLQAAQHIQVQPLTQQAPIRVAVSRRHGGSVKAFMRALGKTETVRMGSAIKICLIAEGAADVYPRFGPTSLWDTAAAHCVLEQAGGQLVDRQGRTLSYHQSESLLNPHFMAVGDATYTWPAWPDLE